MKKEILEYKNRFYDLLESEIGDVKPIISEQTTLLNIPPMNIGIFNDASNPKQILLKGKVNGVDQTLRYNISATYGPISFDVLLKNIKRQNGDLLGQVLPKAMADDNGNKKEECGWSEVTCKALKLAFDKIKESNPKTIGKDGYLNIKVPKDSVEAAIIQLKNKKGSSATMDAGQGVEIKLTKA